MEKENLKSVALKYLTQRGWNVIPLGHDKRPLVAWKEWTTKKQSTKEVESLFHEGNKNICGIGIIVGEVSNLSVVDVDVDSEGKLGKVGDLPMTLIAKTPSGGWHYYYQYSGADKAHDVSKSDGTGRDYKHSGGYVVAPPSRMKYEKHGKTISGDYFFTVDEQTPIEPFPSHLRPQNAEKKGGLIAKSTESLSENIRDNAIKLFEQGAQEGGRNNALYTIVHEFAQDYRASHKDVLYRMIADWNDKKVSPSIIKEEFDATFESAWVNAQAKRKKMVSKDQATDQDEEIKITPPQKIYTLTKDILNTYWGGGERKIAYFDTGIPWIDNMHGLQKRTILTAPSNVGKTQFTIELARRVAAIGKPVLMLNFEESLEALFTKLIITGTNLTDVDMRLNGKNILKDSKYDEQKRLACLIDSIDIDEIQSIEQLHKIIEAWQASKNTEGLVIIDQINSLKYLLQDKKESLDKERDVAKWIRTDLRKAPWTSFILSPQSKADMNGSGINSIAGSAELGYAADTVINFVKNLDAEDEKKLLESDWDRKSIYVHIAKTRTQCVRLYKFPATFSEKKELIPNVAMLRYHDHEQLEEITIEEANKMFNEDLHGL